MFFLVAFVANWKSLIKTYQTERNRESVVAYFNHFPQLSIYLLSNYNVILIHSNVISSLGFLVFNYFIVLNITFMLKSNIKFNNEFSMFIKNIEPKKNDYTIEEVLMTWNLFYSLNG